MPVSLSGSLLITGSLIVTEGITMSGSIASASYASNAELLDGLDSTVFTLTSSFNAQTASFTAFTSSINSFSASILAQTASLNSFSSSVLTFTGSAATRLGALEAATASLYTATSSFSGRLGALEAATASLYTATSSLNAFSASLNSYTSSTDAKIASIYSTTSSLNTRVGTLEAYTSSLNAKTSSFATTSSNTFIGTQTITGSVLQSGSFTSTGTITAQTLVVQTITSSVVYSSGSNIFGNTIANTQTFTGSVNITGSLSLNNITIPTSASLASTYLPLAGGTLTGALSGTSATFSSNIIFSNTNTSINYGSSRFFLYNGTNTYIGDIDALSATASTILRTNGVDRLTILATGAATFSNALQVAGQQAAANYGGTGLNFDFTSGNVGRIASVKTSSGGSSLELHTYNTSGGDNNALVISNTGNVGIGTTSPSEKLDVFGSIRLRTAVQVDSYYATFAQNAYYNGSWNKYSSGYARRIQLGDGISFGISNVSGGGADDPITFNTYLAITDTGSVGIGTTSPGVKLHVFGSAVTPSGGYSIADLVIEESGEAALGIIGTTYSSIYFGDAGTALAGAVVYNHTDNSLGFRTNNNTDKILITSGGNVGIGTTSMDTKLHVFDGSAGTISSYESTGITIENSGRGNLQFLTPANSDAYMFFGAPHASGITANRGYVGYDHASDTMLFFSSGKYSFTSGNVGIGTTSPIFKLSVSDNSNYARTSQSGYALPTVEWNDKSRFRITNGDSSYKGIRTNSLGYKYVRIEADLKIPSSGGTDHFGFFWGANQDDLGINTGVTGYKWVWNPGNSYITLRDINTNTNITTSSTLSFSINDNTWHRWVVEVRPEGIYISVDGVVILTAADIYSVGGYCGLSTYATGYMDVANFNITSLPNEYTKIYKSTTELAGFPAGYYYFSNSNGEIQQLYYDNGYILVASNYATDNTLPKGTSRNTTAYQVNRNGTMGHLGFPSPDRDYLIGGWVNNFTFSGGKVVAFGRGSTNGTYTWNNLGTYITAIWNASSFVGATAAASVTIGGNSSLSSNAAYFTLDAVRNDTSLDANTNQSTIGGAGTQGSGGDPSSGCYLGHGSNEGTIGCEGWYDSANISADSQGYTTWIKT
jgi:hypothetical protein